MASPAEQSVPRLARTREQRLAQQARAAHPPDPAAIDAWKHRMSLDERTRFWAVAGDLLQDLGYDV